MDRRQFCLSLFASTFPNIPVVKTWMIPYHSGAYCHLCSKQFPSRWIGGFAVMSVWRHHDNFLYCSELHALIDAPDTKWGEPIGFVAGVRTEEDTGTGWCPPCQPTFLSANQVTITITKLKERIDRVSKLNIPYALKERIISGIQEVVSLHEKEANTGEWNQGEADKIAHRLYGAGFALRVYFTNDTWTARQDAEFAWWFAQPDHPPLESCTRQNY